MRSFEGRVISKLSVIDPGEIQNFLTHLVREKNFLEIILNALLDGVVVLRPTLEVMLVNNAAREMLGINRRRRVAGVRITELSNNAEFRDLVARFALRRETQTNAEITLTDGAERLVRVSIIPLEADKGSTDGSVIIILHDATETEKLEEQRRRADRATSYTTLAAGLAHEIKNPLNSLQIHAQLLNRALKEQGRGGRPRLDGRVTESSDIILEEIRRLTHVVNQFLDAVRPTRPRNETIDVNRLVERVVATLKPEASDRGVELDFVADHEVPVAEVDPTQITQAVMNLVANAIDAAEGRPEPRVELRTGMMSEDRWFIRVTDWGAGIAKENLPKVLEPYFTTKHHGTGLGLVIVSRIVEEHGGKMEVFSVPDEGTVVSLIFPARTRPVRLLGGGG